MITILMGMEELLYGIYGPTNTNSRVKTFPVRLSKVFTLSKCNMDYNVKTMPIRIKRKQIFSQNIIYIFSLQIATYFRLNNSSVG